MTTFLLVPIKNNYKILCKRMIYLIFLAPILNLRISPRQKIKRFLHLRNTLVSNFVNSLFQARINRFRPFLMSGTNAFSLIFDNFSLRSRT